MSLRHLIRDLNHLGVYSDVVSSFHTNVNEIFAFEHDTIISKYYGKWNVTTYKYTEGIEVHSYSSSFSIEIVQMINTWIWIYYRHKAYSFSGRISRDRWESVACYIMSNRSSIRSHEDFERCVRGYG